MLLSENMRWKAWITVFAVLASSCLFADWVCTHVLLQSPLSDTVRIKHLYQENDGEIPIFGTSKVLGFCCPTDMGLNVYNYGMDGASYEETDVFLQIELAKPKTTPIIVELQHADSGILGEKSEFIPFVFDPRFRQLLKRFNALEWRYFVPGIRYFGYYDWIFKQYLSDRAQVSTIDRGFCEPVHPPPFDRERLDLLVRERLQMPTGFFPNEDQSRRLIAHIAEHPQRLFILVVTPYHPSYYEHFQNELQFKEYEARLEAFNNVVVIDWGRMHYPDEFFTDTVHMRLEGSKDFSKKLGDKIRQVLHDRNDPLLSAKPPA
jgi:hypothetical protein